MRWGPSWGFRTRGLGNELPDSQKEKIPQTLFAGQIIQPKERKLQDQINSN